jgi:hypothetical protein
MKPISNVKYNNLNAFSIYLLLQPPQENLQRFLHAVVILNISIFA